MRVYDKIAENPQILREVGALARSRAKQAGVPSYYEDPSLGEGIVEELPDGTRRLIEQGDSGEAIDRIFGPR